ncbi:MAG TPA: hypothetical protein VHT04_19920 [Stellaceae bacterium]|jgi:hypothetical protein|nr:hypothetical protein [Stellaceae bacterium]
MSTDETPRPETKRHVMTLLVASHRALNNALDDLGFEENDDRVVEHDGRLAFVTCSHEPDCDDLFALIAELAARGENWELLSRIDGEGKAVTFHSLARQRPVEAVDTELTEEPTTADEADLAVQDLDTEAGVAQLRSELSRLDPATLFVSLGSGADGQVVARVVQRTPRRTLAIAKGPDEARMRNAIREILPTVMFDIAMMPPR